MKQIFYTGLLALTVAFGVTSCDKNELPDAPSVGVIVNDEYSKVSFGELGNGIIVPKLKSDAASKNASEFTHIYSSTPQILSIVDVDGASVYTGSYPANDISQINPSSIILANNAGYVASSSNTSTVGLGIVSSFLPYTSTVGFDLSASTRIVLEATLDRGFLIVNVEDANEGARVQSATVQVGEGAKVSLLDGGDGDYYGYLADGTYNVDVTYLLDGDAIVVSTPEPKVIAAGSAYTIELMLSDEAPAVVGSITSTSTLDGLESAIGENGAGRDINDDDDLLDTLVRIVTSIQATLDGEPTDAAPDVSNGPWSVVLDHDILVEVGSEDSTEEAADEFVNSDTDKFDTITRVVTTTTASINDVPGTPGIVNGDWTILLDYSSVFVDENNNGVNDADEVVVENGVDTYTYSDFSGTAPDAETENGDWGPLTADSDVEFIAQTRTAVSVVAAYQLTREATIVQVDALDVPAPATEALTQDVAESRTDLDDETRSIDNPDYSAPAPIVARTYSAWGPAYADNIVDFSQSRTVTNDGAFNDPDVAVEALTRAVVAVYSVTTAPEAGVIGVGTWTSMAGTVLVGTHNVDIAALPAEDVDVTWTDSTVTGKTSYVGSDTDYNFAVEGALNDVIVSGISFPEAISIVVPAYLNGVAFPGVSDTTYTLQSSQEIILGAPIADVVALIQAAINQ